MGSSIRGARRGLSFAEAKGWAQEALRELSAEQQEDHQAEQMREKQYQVGIPWAIMGHASIRCGGGSDQRSGGSIFPRYSL